MTFRRFQQQSFILSRSLLIIRSELMWTSSLHIYFCFRQTTIDYIISYLANMSCKNEFLVLQLYVSDKQRRFLGIVTVRPITCIDKMSCCSWSIGRLFICLSFRDIYMCKKKKTIKRKRIGLVSWYEQVEEDDASRMKTCNLVWDLDCVWWCTNCLIELQWMLIHREVRLVDV